MVADVKFRLLIFHVLLKHSLSSGEQISMKIVDEPSNFGIHNPYGQPSQESTLKMRIIPANFSGPPHLHHLVGKCFSKTDDSYRYDFCPFSNLTQHEQSLRWNPYSGVLGVWQEWEIENNTFVAMVMREGDPCGSIFRSVRVLLKCGEKEEIGAVSEPATCHYQIDFKTPLVCHPHSLLVYPTLSVALQGEWDQLEGYVQRQMVTKQGYNKRLRHIFENAGYYMSQSTQRQILEKAVSQEHKAIREQNGQFDSLAKCTEEYQKLKQEIAGLKTLLALNNNNEGLDPTSLNTTFNEEKKN